MDEDSCPPDPAVREEDWPVYRNNLLDFLKYSKRRHHVAGTWEIDFTLAQARMQAIQRTTRCAISLNAYLIFHLARAATMHPEVQAVRIPWRRKIALFEGADVGTAVELRIPGKGSLPLPYTVRQADKKSLAAICEEMRLATRSNLLETDPGIRWRARLAHYPAWLRRLQWLWVDLNPARRQRVRGTIGITNVNFLTDHQRPVFGFPMALLTTGLCVGSLYDRLVPDDRDPRGFSKRTMLCATLFTDHDVVDGAPLARFGRTLTFALERAEGLDDSFAEELKARCARRKASEIAKPKEECRP